MSFPKSASVFTILTLFFSATCAQWLPNIAPDTRTLDQIYAAAQEETGPLQVFLGGDAGVQGDGVRSAWKARFPNVTLNLTVDLSKYHDGRIDRAYYENTHIADVAALQTLQDFPRWKSENRLSYYKPSNFDDLLENEKDFDGAYLPIQINSFGTFFYDNTKLASSSVPTSFAALTSPEWRSKLILTYPNDDDAVAYLFSLIVSRYGIAWLSALAANDVQWVRGTGTPVFELIRQHPLSSSRSLSFTVFQPNAPAYIASQQPEAPEQIMSWAQRGAIIAGTPRLESARLFLAWLTSAEVQNGTEGATVLESLNRAKGVDLYGSKITQTTGFQVFEQDRATVERWKNVFEDVIGTPQGPPPLQIYPNPA